MTACGSCRNSAPWMSDGRSRLSGGAWPRFPAIQNSGACCWPRRGCAACPRCSSSPHSWPHRTRASGPPMPRLRPMRPMQATPIHALILQPYWRCGSGFVPRHRPSAVPRCANGAARIFCRSCACASGRICTLSSAAQRRDQELRRNEAAANHADLHRAALSGLLGSIGILDERREYLGARGTRFVIAPGTPLAAKPPKWVVAAHLLETTRLYARMSLPSSPAGSKVSPAICCAVSTPTHTG